MVKIIVLCLFCVVLARGARILAVVPTPSYSHQIHYFPVWKELSLKGHQVTVMTSDLVGGGEFVNLTEINMHHTYELIKDIYKKFEELSTLQLLKELRRIFLSVAEEYVTHPDVKRWVDQNQEFDVVLVEAFFPECLVLGELFKAPTVLVSTMDASSVIHRYVGNEVHGFAMTEYNVPIYDRKSFTGRFLSTVYHVFIRSFPGFVARDAMLRQHFGDSIASVDEMLNKVSMTFLNTNPIMMDVRAMAPSTIQYGGMIHIKDPKPLPQDLQQYLDSATNGAILFSLGSNVKSRNLDSTKLATIVDTMKKLPYKIIWKYEDELDDVPSNVKLVKWIPQQDVLRHPNLKLFITQGGLQSLEEAIYYDVPMVVLPVYGDQHVNAKRLEEKGVGIYVEHIPTLCGETFHKAILDAINNPKYKENIINLHRLLLDQPMTGLEKIVWWTEYVIRNKGAKHLRSAILDIPLYQYYYLDIIAVVLLVLFIIYSVIKFILRFIIGLFKSKSISDKKTR